MRLQKHFAYMHGGKRYYKNVIVIPDEIIMKLDWNIGDEIGAETKEDELILRAKRTPTSKPLWEAKDPYEDFRDQIKKILESEPDGLTWAEINERLQLSQRAPYHKWVRRMEKDIGLRREKVGQRIVWKIKS